MDDKEKWEKAIAVIEATRGYVTANSLCRCIHCHNMREALEAWDGKPLGSPDTKWDHSEKVAPK